MEDTATSSCEWPLLRMEDTETVICERLRTTGTEYSIYLDNLTQSYGYRVQHISG
jgi:hypothetical protein